MNVLFLTMNPFTDIEMHNIYSDLMQEFVAHGHRPYIVTPREKKTGEKTERIDYDTYSILKVQIGNTSDVSLIEKGISTVTLSARYQRAVLRELGDLSFGLILYSTPPITLVGPVKRLKKQFGCRTYLMLKDIFPQNAVDLQMFASGGLLHRYFRRQETQLYAISDRIGCMSQANIDYLQRHNPEIPVSRIGLCPNGIAPHPVPDHAACARQLRARYRIPDSAVVYLYGGNLGKPQGIDHLIDCLRENANRPDRFFLICGSGSEYPLLADYLAREHPDNVVLERLLPKQEYDTLAAGCDVGLIFLDGRFTIPNYPSRILSYMENQMPVIVCADRCTDVGTDAAENGYGLFCTTEHAADFTACIDRMNLADREAMGRRARAWLEENFTAARCYAAVMDGERSR